MVAMSAACRLPPRYSIKVEHCTVRAHDRATARKFARLTDELVPVLMAFQADLMPKSRVLEIWITDIRKREGYYNRLTHRIVLRAGSEEERVSLAHELVHALEGPVWATLPAVIQEGMAEWIAVQVAAENIAAERVERAIPLGTWLTRGLKIPTPTGSLRIVSGVGKPMPPNEALKIPHRWIRQAKVETYPALYALGFFLVDRIGIAHLRELAVRAAEEGLRRIPGEWLLDAAEVDPSPAGWQEWMDQLIDGESERRELRKRYKLDSWFGSSRESKRPVPRGPRIPHPAHSGSDDARPSSGRPSR